MPWTLEAACRAGYLGDSLISVKTLAFTPYLAATAWIPVVIALALRRRLWAATAAVAGASLVIAILPRVIRDADVPTTGPTLRVMALNTRRGQASASAIVNLVHQRSIDVLALEEVTAPLEAALDVAGVAQRLPYREPRARGVSRTILLSRWPVRPRLNPTEPLHSDDLFVRVLRPGQALDLSVAHPPSPTTSEKAARWRLILHDLAQPPFLTDTTIILGDFNATLDHPELRRLLQSGLVDAAEAMGAGLRPTFSDNPFPPITIDHVLATRDLRAAAYSVVAVHGTDHKAIVAELVG